MIIHTAICDDSSADAARLSALVEGWAKDRGHTVRTRLFPSAENYLFRYEDDSGDHILLLDVEMGQMSGVELAKRLRKDNNRAQIIFITSHTEFYGEGYEVDALHYLIKPVSADKLFPALDRAAERLTVQPPSLILSFEGQTLRLPEDEILYVESFLHYVTVHTKDREYKVKENLSAIEERLSGGFYKIHRSYLTSIRHITKIKRTSVLLDGKIELPLARGKFDELNRAFIDAFSNTEQ